LAGNRSNCPGPGGSRGRRRSPLRGKAGQTVAGRVRGQGARCACVAARLLGPDHFQARLKAYRDAVDNAAIVDAEALRKARLGGLLADAELVASLIELGFVSDEMVFKVSGPSLAELGEEVRVYRTTNDKVLREWLEGQMRFRQMGYDLLLRMRGMMLEAEREAVQHARQVVDGLSDHG